MIPAVFVEDLRRRGIELTTDGEMVRYRAPRGTLTADILAQLREHKADLVNHFHRCDRADEREVAVEPGAVLVDAAVYGEIWLLVDSRCLARLVEEESRRPSPRPIMFVRDVGKFAHKSPEMIAAALRVAAVFPGSRVIQ